MGKSHKGKTSPREILHYELMKNITHNLQQNTFSKKTLYLSHTSCPTTPQKPCPA